MKDNRYFVTSINAYNSLGVGATQLYNKTVVYNHKRHGSFMLGGREFEFCKKPAFPKTVTKEFLLVDLVNNLGQLAEDCDQVPACVKDRALQGNRTALTRAAKEYGMLRTRKLFNTLAADSMPADFLHRRKNFASLLRIVANQMPAWMRAEITDDILRNYAEIILAILRR